CDGTLPVNAVLNGVVKSGAEYSYNQSPGECTFKCNDGYYYDDSHCKQIYSWTGSSAAGYAFLNQGVENYPKSCNDLITSTSPNFKIEGGPYNGTDFVDGVYWIKPNASAAFKVYCNMTIDGGGWTIVANNDNADNEPTGCYAKIASTSSLTCGDGSIVANDFAVPSWGIELSEIVWATYTGQNFSNVSSYNYGKVSGGYTIPNMNNFVIAYSVKNQSINDWILKPKITGEGNSLGYFGNRNSLGYIYGTNIVTVLSLNSALTIDNLSFTDGYSNGDSTFSQKGFDDFQDGSGLGDVREPKAVRGQSSFIMIR
ncbi:MAG: fibrinogen-like YCDxxxxGGGW domain-containing protein, partial [Candidatus Absconditabacteria bacterium]